MTSRSLATACTAALAAFLVSPAHAGSNDGKIQIKAMATAVLPDGKISSVQTDRIGLAAGSQAKATDSLLPTLAAELFLSPSFSIETICCVTPHDVRGAGPLAGARLIENAMILPATVTAKYHFQLTDRIKPYVGAGPAHFFIFSEDVGRDAAALGATEVNLSNEFGLALQGGVDISLNERGLGLSLDAKRYFVGTKARFRAGPATVLASKHDLDPWVVSAGLAYRF